jgi:UDP-N-acetylglucosamine acyltransferase
MIHPTAIIEEGAVLGADCNIHAHAIITRHATLGDGVVVHPFAVVGGDPQDLNFNPATPSRVLVGANTVIRESVTINRSTKSGGETQVGEHCFLMACSHVAHDCTVGDRVVLANNVLLAGHVSIGNHAFIGGGAGLHQFCRLGESAMVSGLSRLSLDVPPFTMAVERDEIVGLNLVGLKRRNYSREIIAELKECFREIYYTGGNLRLLASNLLQEGKAQTPEARRFLEFFGGGKRGIARARRIWTTEQGEGNVD